MSAANARCSSGVGHRVAAVLDHDGRAGEPRQPGQRLDQRARPCPARCPGPASRVAVHALMSSTPSSRARRRATGRWSRSWRRRRRRAGRSVMVTSRPVRSTLERSSAAAPPRQTHTPLIATSTLVRLERRGGGADRGEDPAPVRVVAEQRGLDQVVAGDRPADLDRVVLARPRRRTSMAISLVAPSASASSCWARSWQAAVTAAVSSAGVGSIAGRAAGQQQHGVVGGHAAVGVEPVEGDPGGRAQRRVQRRRRRPPRRW